MVKIQRAAASGYLRKQFYSGIGAGLLAGAVFPPLASLLLGPEALSLAFFAVCLAGGGFFGSLSYWCARAALKHQLRQQLEQLQRLTGRAGSGAGETSIEALNARIDQTAAEIHALLHTLRTTADGLLPHCLELGEAGRYLSARADDGLLAAQNARGDVDSLTQKQQAVMFEVENLTSRAQDEAAISRELSAALEGMAGALERSTQKFQETSQGVNEVVDTIRQASVQVDEVSRTMESSAHDLDGINAALDALRQAVAATAAQADDVKGDAEHGLQVVESFIQEMTRIDQESQKTVAAMQRLTVQTAEVTKILAVIKDLVSDTELLAFNAAIIAAKAGAEGRGFSVVAEEIRDLADRTTTSAGEIEAIVKNIREDTHQVGTTIESTSHFIGRGTELSRNTGAALRKIVASSSQAARESGQLADDAGRHGRQVRALVESAGSSLRSVRAIARAFQRQEEAVGRIQNGVGEMKAATDQIARGFDEQVRANRELDRSLLAREAQVQAICAATSFQMETANRVLEHFKRSEERLGGNVAKARAVTREIAVLEELARQLRDLAANLGAVKGGKP